MLKMKINCGVFKCFKVKKNLIKCGSVFKSYILIKKSFKCKVNLNAFKYVYYINAYFVMLLFCRV